MRCPKCKQGEMIVFMFDRERALKGALKPEILKCEKCGLEEIDAEYFYWVNVYTSDLRAELKENKDKLKKRGVQIADLKHKIKELKEERDYWNREVIEEHLPPKS